MEYMHIIRLIALALIWVILYFIIGTLEKRYKYVFFIYFGILTAVFTAGYIFYFVRYDLHAGPAPPELGDFGNWVYTFSIMFVIPFILVIIISLYRFVSQFPKWQKIILAVVAVINGVILTYILTFVFMLIFYGLAP